MFLGCKLLNLSHYIPYASYKRNQTLTFKKKHSNKLCTNKPEPNKAYAHPYASEPSHHIVIANQSKFAEEYKIVNDALSGKTQSTKGGGADYPKIIACKDELNKQTSHLDKPSDLQIAPTTATQPPSIPPPPELPKDFWAAKTNQLPWKQGQSGTAKVTNNKSEKSQPSASNTNLLTELQERLKARERKPQQDEQNNNIATKNKHHANPRQLPTYDEEFLKQIKQRQASYSSDSENNSDYSDYDPSHATATKGEDFSTSGTNTPASNPTPDEATKEDELNKQTCNLYKSSDSQTNLSQIAPAATPQPSSPPPVPELPKDCLVTNNRSATSRPATHNTSIFAELIARNESPKMGLQHKKIQQAEQNNDIKTKVTNEVGHLLLKAFNNFSQSCPPTLPGIGLEEDAGDWSDDMASPTCPPTLPSIGLEKDAGDWSDDKIPGSGNSPQPCTGERHSSSLNKNKHHANPRKLLTDTPKYRKPMQQKQSRHASESDSDADYSETKSSAKHIKSSPSRIFERSHTTVATVKDCLTSGTNTPEYNPAPDEATREDELNKQTSNLYKSSDSQINPSQIAPTAAEPAFISSTGSRASKGFLGCKNE